MKYSSVLDSSLQESWKTTEAATEFSALPKGKYVCRIEEAKLVTSLAKGTPAYNLRFKVLEGGYSGRCLWHNIWLTEPALPMAKRDLAKLGITELSQLDQPLPTGFRCEVTVALRRDDMGYESNRVQRFDVVGVDKPEPDAFAPPAEPVAAGGVHELF